MKKDAKVLQQPFDRDAFLGNFQGLDDLVKATIDRFFVVLPGMLNEIEVAIKNRDNTTLELSSHKLKGVISNFRAEPCRLLALRLEKIGAGELELDPIEVFFEFKAELKVLLAALESFCEERKSA